MLFFLRIVLKYLFLNIISSNSIFIYFSEYNLRRIPERKHNFSTLKNSAIIWDIFVYIIVFYFKLESNPIL